MNGPPDEISLGWLTDIGVEARYPGEDADPADAARAIAIMKDWNLRLRAALGIPPSPPSP